MKCLSAVSRTLVLLFLSGGVVGQPTKDQSTESGPQSRQVEARKALDAWFAADPRDRDERSRDKVVAKVMAADLGGLDLLARRSKRADQGEDRKLRTAAQTIVGQVALRWLAKTEKSPARYAGQYADLRRLQPMVGEFYLRLLLDTPQWFPDTRRWQVIPALRDLYPKGPDPETLEQVEIMANNVDVEPEPLRVGLAYALAQWGRRDLIKVKIRALEKQAESKEEEVALLAKRDLAKIHYGIRDYAFGAVAYRQFLRAAESAKMVYPVNYYNAACCMCLSGDRRSALQFLEKCLAINNSANVDSSMRVKRALFDSDPEINLVRKDPRFVLMVEKAFGKREKEGNPRGKTRAPR